MRPRITFANVVSVIALFVALGGTAIATHPGGQDTISTADIINGQVKTADIGDGEVTVTDIGQGAVQTAELANGEVKTADIGQGQVRADELAANAVGASEMADGQVGAAEIATEAVRTEELRNGQVQAEDLAPGVAPGASGARAWGLVSFNGNLLRSKQVTAVIQPPDEQGDGIFCIDPAPGIDPSTAVMVVGEDFSDNNTNTLDDDVAHIEWESSPSNCPAGTMEVRTFIGAGNSASGGEFDLGGFTLVEQDQGFAFVIP